MSPILVRPVREQLEHDRVIRLLQQDLQKRKVEVGINPGSEQNASVGSGSRKEYPDAVVYSLEKGKKVVAVVEVETGESVNHLEAMAQWAHLAKLRVPFHLYVPINSVDVARRLSHDYKIAVTEIWSYHQVGEQFKFTLFHPASGSRGGRASTPPQNRVGGEHSRGVAARAGARSGRAGRQGRARVACQVGGKGPGHQDDPGARGGSRRACRQASRQDASCPGAAGDSREGEASSRQDAFDQVGARGGRQARRSAAAAKGAASKVAPPQGPAAKTGQQTRHQAGFEGSCQTCFKADRQDDGTCRGGQVQVHDTGSQRPTGRKARQVDRQTRRQTGREGGCQDRRPSVSKRAYSAILARPARLREHVPAPFVQASHRAGPAAAALLVSLAAPREGRTRGV